MQIFQINKVGRCIVIIACMAIGLYFRIIGLNWDDNQHLHPDERFLTMVSTSLSTTGVGVEEYFDTENSTLNPYNVGFGFFVYGTAPVIAVRYLSEMISGYDIQYVNELIFWDVAFGTGYNEINLVGRLLSAISDSLAILFVYFIGKNLYGYRVGLLAAFFYAGTVALIQQAHFYTVDSLANFFAVVSIYVAVNISESNRFKHYLIFGVIYGLAISSKISLVLVILLLPIALLVYSIKYKNIKAKIFLSGIIRICCAVFVALLVFRILMPYAFDGPDLYNFSLNKQWLNNMAEISNQMSGDIDFPPNHQWTDRKPVIFPLTNMIMWGMGPSLGLIVWLGFACACIQIYQNIGKNYRHIIPVVWGGAFFLWYSIQWVKPIRYFLPIYSVFVILGAWLLVAILDIDFDSIKSVRFIRDNRILTVFSNIFVGSIILSVFLYAFAFTRIYTRPVTRVEASEWIYENILAAFTLSIVGENDNLVQHVPLPSSTKKYNQGEKHSVQFVPKMSGWLSSISIAHLGDVVGDLELETYQIVVSEVGELEQDIYTSSITKDLSFNTEHIFVVEPPLYLENDKVYVIRSHAVSGGPIAISGSHIINESSWDDGLPLRLRGYDGFGGLYVGHNLELYSEDNDIKKKHIVNSLDRSDYLIISSNRQYKSIPRLPERYPLTLKYYNELFAENLGYKIIAEFESSPNLGSLTFSDQNAEEPFTVYDHPKVYIFKKIDSFSSSHINDILDSVDLDQVLWMTPKQATDYPGSLMMPADMILQQRVSGTWSDLFNRNDVQNSNHVIAFLFWWSVFVLFGLISFPVTYFIFANLCDRGYALAKLVGLVFVTWIVWIVSSYKIMASNQIGIFIVVILFSCVSSVIGITHREDLIRWIRANIKYIVRVECLWIFMFTVFVLIRFFNPDLWHPIYGGEKPMDFAYFNAVIKSKYFPPYDPWYSGGYINYYYFGYLLCAIPTILLGIVPSIAYNLLIPTIFATTGLAAFCCAYNLASFIRKKSRVLINMSPTLAGIASMSFMVICGNLGQPRTLFSGMQDTFNRVGSLFNNITNLDFGNALQIVQEILAMSMLRLALGEYYWNATRIIPAGVGEVGPITEFPFFTFLYGDLHAHMISMPITLLVVAWTISIMLPNMRNKFLSYEIIHCCMGGFFVGLLGVTNTWDYPGYLLLCCFAIFWQSNGNNTNQVRGFLFGALRSIVVVLISYLLFLPYYKWNGSFYSDLVIWKGSKTPLISYFEIHGLFLFIIFCFLFVKTKNFLGTREGLWGSLIGSNPIKYGVVIPVVLIILSVVFYRSGIYITPVVVIIVTWSCYLLLLSNDDISTRFCYGMICFAVLITYGVETVNVAGDIGRMNTVFKFYLQAWTIFSVVCGVAFSFLIASSYLWSSIFKNAWSIMMTVLIFISASYTVLASSAKIRDRIISNASSLDGMNFMVDGVYYDRGQEISLRNDYNAIIWMQDNVKGSPTIVEAHTPEYRWGSRYSIYTGLPTVIGWNWHQRQQRGFIGSRSVVERVEEVSRFYSDPKVSNAVQFLKKYNVSYIVLGEYEFLYYPMEGMEKFRKMVELDILSIEYDELGTTIYGYRIKP